MPNRTSGRGWPLEILRAMSTIFPLTTSISSPIEPVVSRAKATSMRGLGELSAAAAARDRIRAASMWNLLPVKRVLSKKDLPCESLGIAWRFLVLAHRAETREQLRHEARRRRRVAPALGAQLGVDVAPVPVLRFVRAPEVHRLTHDAVFGAVDDLGGPVRTHLLDDAAVGERIVQYAIAVLVPGVVEVDQVALARDGVKVVLAVPLDVAEDDAHPVIVRLAAFRHEVDAGRPEHSAHEARAVVTERSARDADGGFSEVRAPCGQHRMADLPRRHSVVAHLLAGWGRRGNAAAVDIDHLFLHHRTRACAAGEHQQYAPHLHTASNLGWPLKPRSSGASHGSFAGAPSARDASRYATASSNFPRRPATRARSAKMRPRVGASSSRHASVAALPRMSAASSARFCMRYRYPRRSLASGRGG